MLRKRIKLNIWFGLVNLDMRVCFAISHFLFNRTVILMVVCSVLVLILILDISVFDLS